MIGIETDLDALWNAFSESKDFAILAMISDEYQWQEHEEMAECLRWCVEKVRVAEERSDIINFHWFTEDMLGWGSNCIGSRFGKVLINTNYSEWYYGSPTLRRSYEFLCEAWQRLSDTDKQQCWNWTPPQ